MNSLLLLRSLLSGLRGCYTKAMRVSCVLTTDDAAAAPADILVFPEGVLQRTLLEVARAHPSSIVIGAVEEGGYCHAVLLAGGRNHLDYRKIDTDGFGRAHGTGLPPRTPIYEAARVCIGLCICMDVNRAEFISPLLSYVRSSTAPIKLVCIPGDMMQVWFSGGLNSTFEGVCVVVCNNVRTYQGASRRASFISDMHRQMAVVQKEYEPISYEIVES